MPLPRDRKFAELTPYGLDEDGLPGLCRDGSPHQFDGVECSGCGLEPDLSDAPDHWHAPDEGHPCFRGCRHLSHREGD
jgi:hypothetical protein